MSSFIAILSFADGGIGNGLLAAIASSYGIDDRDHIKACISSAYFALSLVAIVLIVGFFSLYPFIDWSDVFNVHSALAQQEAGFGIASLVICFACSIPAGLVQKVQAGLQRGFVASTWQCVSSLLTLGGVLMAVHFRAGLPTLVTIYAGIPLLASLCNSLLFFQIFEPDIAPQRSSVARKAIHSIAGAGVLYFVLQIVGALTYASDNIVIAQVLGATSVTTYAVPDKLFGLISVVVAMAAAPLWPAYGEAISRGDRAWVSRALKKSLLTSVLIASICSSAFVMFGTRIIAWWAPHALLPPFDLILGFGVWKVIEAAGIPIAMYLNGSNVVRFQVFTSLLTVAIAVPLKFFLTSRIGVAGPVLATIFAFTLFSLVPNFMIVRETLVREKQ